MSETPETSKQYYDRKMKEILDILEIAKNSDGILSLKMEDTLMPTPSGPIPVVHVYVTVSESIIAKWKEKK